MALQPGQILGSYEVVALLGRGGMGEVYRARDARLNRDVAIKVLPDAFVNDAERLARFEREARLISQLNHPNTALFHIGDAPNPQSLVPNPSTIQYLVMELVEGPTLADLIAGAGAGPRALSIEEALPIARQIAEALEAAHERGIIHRDLKPANIKVKSDGVVKVLDFGLAKLADGSDVVRVLPYGPAGRAGSKDQDPAHEISQLPTITSPALATQAGVILGTAAYMSPEQARGKDVDKRTDIWAFGCVLYEMLTGKRAFEGEEVSDTLAEVLKSEPNWRALPEATPESIRRLLRRCLAKDRHARLSDASVARLEIDDARDGAASQPPSAIAAKSRVRQLIPLLSTAFITAALALVAWRLSPDRPADDRDVTRFTIQLPADLQLDAGAISPISVSRDGRRIAFAGGRAGDVRLWVRSLAQLEATPVRGTEGARGLFFSPDGQWVGYFDAGGLKKIRLEGGAGVPVPLVKAAGLSRGGSWGSDGTIVFASSAGSAGLMRVPDSGGTAQALTTPTGEVHSRPYFLPDGQALVYTSQRQGAPAQIALLALNTGESRVLIEGDEARVTAQGFLVFRRQASLWAAPFDLRRRALTGEPVPLVDLIRGGDFDVADNGTLVQAPPRESLNQRSLVWVDRRGAEHPTNAPQRGYVYPRISPDGAQFALDVRDQQNDIWIWHTVRQTLTRLTFSPTLDRFPVWSPDGKRVAFTAEGSGLSWQPADGSGPVEPLSDPSKAGQVLLGANNPLPTSFSPDGRKLLFWGTSTSDIHVLQLDSERRAAPLLETNFNERGAEVSPDGRWLAYESDESGRFEIHVRPFPDVNRGKWQISSAGGTQPLWARNSRELFFRSPTGAVMRVAIDAAATTFSYGVPVRLFEGPYFRTATAIVGRTYDISPDGQRFLMIKEDGLRNQTADYPIVVQNAFAELKGQKP